MDSFLFSFAMGMSGLATFSLSVLLGDDPLSALTRVRGAFPSSFFPPSSFALKRKEDYSLFPIAMFPPHDSEYGLSSRRELLSFPLLF